LVATDSEDRKALRVLLVEDSPPDAELLMASLADGGYDAVAERVQTAEEMRQALARGGWQLILSDYSLPAFSGPEALAIAKELDPDIPFIIVSGTVGEDIAVKALKAGACDFLVKGRLARLNSAIERELREVELRREREVEREALEERLRQSQKLEGIGRLAGGIAHDFNNLLTAIIGYTEMVLDQIGPDKPISKDLDEIRRASDRAVALTRQLLAFSRKQTLKVVPTDLNGIIVSMRNMLERLIGEDIAIQSRLAEHLPQVLADRVQIEQVVLNLIMNARDAMPRGGVIAIETRPVESGAVESAAHEQVTPGRYVELIISDTGQGMDGATQARIFEPFFTTKGAGEGTGLGLATVYGVVQQLGGHIAVTSIIGRGTTFSLYFPECTQISHPLDPVAKKSSPAPLASGREVVLVVEDQRGVRQLAARILTRHGYMVCEAADAVEAIKIASNPRQPIDLVVSDVVMPKMGGPELMERLWALRPALKVLYMSGYTGDELSRRVGQETSITVLEKPFSASALLQTVRDVLDESDFFVAGSHPPAST
jgi:two-component system, cell cycle sensor histidine kinase and response regulator CckA